MRGHIIKNLENNYYELFQTWERIGGTLNEIFFLHVLQNNAHAIKYVANEKNSFNENEIISRK